jgi:IS5 family transposase
MSRKELGLFDYHNRLEELASRPNALSRLDQIVNWERFRNVLTRLLIQPSKGPGGRPRFDVVFMFKVLVLQRTYGLSDAEVEAQVLDRFSFQRFLGITVADPVPDQNTIWDFREDLRRSGGMNDLWKQFERMLLGAGVKLTSGKIVDASFVDLPRQRNNRDENNAIRKGETPESWEKKSDASLRQKDVDARWADKAGERHFGYKNHIKIDEKTKLIERYHVTHAKFSDSKALSELVEGGDRVLYADKGYDGQPNADLLSEHGIADRRLKQARWNHPLTKHQKRTNRSRSRIRARVEHVFGFMAQVMKADWIRGVGIERARFTIGLNNLVYNLHRFAFLRTRRA